MKKLKLLSVAVCCIVLLISGCASGKDGGKGETASTETAASAPETVKPAEPAKTPAVVEDPIKTRLAGMSLDEKIGQLLVFGFSGTSLDQGTTEMLDRYKPGGLIIMGENVKSAGQLLELVNSLKAVSSESGIPAFISVDEEGGRVSRMPPELKNIPSALTVGKTGNAGIAGGVGSAVAGELKAFGFNMDFAPVLDIWSNPQNTVIGDRAFGTDADTVGRLGVSAMNGIASAGVIPVVKHFPGHGDTTADSHKELPVSDSTMERLESFELKPFYEAVANGADAVMVAHILLTQVDAKYPASLSKAVITDILRNKMGFGGVVITDDLTMAAISKNYGLAEAAVLAFQAGSDLILVVHGSDSQAAVAGALKNAAASGEITRDRLDESVYRILKLKEKYNLENVPVEAVDIEKLNSSIEKAVADVHAGR